MSSGTEERNRDGRWTNEDVKYMEENVGVLSIEEMALQLRRNAKTVRKYCTERLAYVEPKSNKFDIKRSPVWEELKLQLSEQELETFMYHWQNLMSQFSKDIPLSTERMQMVELVRIEILINRVMRKLKDSDVTFKKTEDELMQEKDKPVEMRDGPRMASLEMIIASINTSRVQISKDYKEFMSKKEEILRSLKATREARIKRVEDSKQTLQTWMSALLDNAEMRRSLGIEAKKQQLALYSELNRLSDYHTFLDGNLEQPILNHETIKIDNI